MASDLRWITLVGAIAAGSVDDDRQAVFRNESDDELDIIVVQRSITTATMNNDELAELELSKSPTRASIVDQDGTFRIPDRLRGPNAEAASEGGQQINHSIRFDDGEVTLEPQEALFVNSSKTTGVAVRFEYVIGFRFQK